MDFGHKIPQNNCSHMIKDHSAHLAEKAQNMIKVFRKGIKSNAESVISI